GFSFGILRLSTVLLAVFGCAALYLTLRELEFDRWRSLFGALTLAVNPVFFVLSFSFMTDVPFLSLMNIAVLCYAVGLKRNKSAWLWAGGAFAAAAFLIRPFALVIPLALIPCLVNKGEDWSKLRSRLAPVVASLLSMVLLWLWLWKWMGQTGVIASRWESLRYWFLVSPGDYLNFNLKLAFYISFAIFPLLIATISLRPRWWPLVIAALAVGG